MDKKRSGSYYTPPRLARLVVDYCLEILEGRDRIAVIEPSAGDGAFVNAISTSASLSKFGTMDLTTVELDAVELGKVVSLNLDDRINLDPVNSDYLDFHFGNTQRYTLCIGNPPYVKKNLLTTEQKEKAKEIHLEAGLGDKNINNIWTAFLVSGIGKLEADGILAFILPLELLQVKFTEEIRLLLKNAFQRIEIFTFNELQFQECKGQDTVLLVGYKQSVQGGTFYTDIPSLEIFERKQYAFYQNSALADTERKWTHHFITPEEYAFLEGLKGRLRKVSDYVDNKAGIVTAANNYFIVGADTVKAFGLQDFAKPILQKGFYVNGSITFDAVHFADLLARRRPAYLLDFNQVDEMAVTEGMSDYFRIGLDRKIQERFKCKQRKTWYKVPNISTVPSAFFFKRAHDYPKLLANEIGVLVTDSAYKIEMRAGFELNNFLFSFYNSLTLVFSELDGRYYGGGVLELTPNEFRGLPIPYVAVGDFEEYKLFFERKVSIEEVLERFNYQILNRALGIGRRDIRKIELIRKKLVAKRQKSN